MAVTLNALASVPMIGGTGTSLPSRLVDSLDALSIIDGCPLSSPGSFAQPYSRLGSISCCGSSCDFDELVFILDCRA